MKKIGNYLKKIISYKSGCTIVMGIILILPMIWLHSIIRINSNIEVYNVFYLFYVGIIIGITIFYFGMLKMAMEVYDEEGEEISSGLMKISFIYVVFLISIIVEVFCWECSIYSSNVIEIFGVEISKYILYDLIVIIGFPLILEYIFMAVESAKFEKRAVIIGGLNILALSCIEYFLFCVFSQIWIINMGVLNLVSMIFLTIKYALRNAKIRQYKGNAIAILVYYSLFWLAIILPRCVQGIDQERLEGIRVLIGNANLIGAASNILEMRNNYEWLLQSTNYIHQLLLYGGWITVVFFILLLIAFLIVIYKMIGIRYFTRHKHQVVYLTVFTMFAIRVIFGLLYSFGICMCRVNLPFASDHSLVSDAILYAVLLVGAWENNRMDKLLQCKYIKAEDVLGDCSSYKMEIINENNRRNNWTVRLIGKNTNVTCFLETCEIEESEKLFGCFEISDGMNHNLEVILLQYEEDDKTWHSIEDEIILESVKREYLEYNISSIMEVRNDTKDEKKLDED